MPFLPSAWPNLLPDATCKELLLSCPHPPALTLLPFLHMDTLCRDLIHPHHDNEIAQSQAACCSSHSTKEAEDFVKLWMHIGFVNGM